MDEFRISFIPRYTSGFTPETTAYKADNKTALLLHMDGGGNFVDGVPTKAGEGTYFWDASTNALFYDAEGLPSKKSYMNFDGSTDYLTCLANPDWNLAATDFTIEMFVNFTAVNTYNFLIGNFYNEGGTGTGNKKAWMIRYNSDGTIIFRYTKN